MKVRTNILIEKEILVSAHEMGLNVSKSCENSLKQLIRAMQSINQPNGNMQQPFLNECSFAKENSKEPRAGIEPATCSLQGCEDGANTHTPIDWEAFMTWLEETQKLRHRVALNKVSYSKKYGHCLLERNLAEVRDLRETLRPNVIKALASLSKYLGIYQDFKKMLSDFGLQWVGKSSSDIMIERLQKVKDPNQIYAWIKETKEARPDLSDLLDLMAYTGLRLSEAINSYNLIIQLNAKGESYLCEEYYNEKTQTLEHFKHKETFLRSTKKAFVSFVPRELITRITQNQPTSYDSIHGDFVRDGRSMKFSDIREAHATFMTKYLREAEIDFLHGRCASSVFMRNYFNPALIGDLEARAMQGIQGIQERIK